MLRKFLAGLLLWSPLFTFGQYLPNAENLKNRDQFQDDKFGMFIHWGIYANLAEGEWAMRNRGIPVSNYERLAGYFNPIRFDAEQWVLLAKNAGMRYITFTSRHHDGFSMFASRHSDFNIVKATPFGKDIVAELAKACKKHGLKLFLYYSHLDWRHPDYFPRANTSLNANGVDWTGRPKNGNWANYLQFMNLQLEELLTNYGEIGGIWFDGWWDKKDADWKLQEQYQLIHRLQPGCLVGNNHHQALKEGEDFQMFEKDLPGQNTTGFSGESEIGQLPLEMCETMNGSWGYNIKDTKFKSTRTLIQLLVKNAGFGSNFLLNVGPQPDGMIQEEFADTLAKVGQWMKIYGETIYGTRKSEYPNQAWGVVLKKGTNHLIHVLESNNQSSILVPGWKNKPRTVREWKSGKPIKFEYSPLGLVIDLNRADRQEPDYILQIEP